MRFVGFASTHQKILKEFLQKRKSVELQNCQIKKSNRDSDKLEVLVKGATKIHPSTKTFDVSAVEFNNTEATRITLDQVEQKRAYTITNIDVKVISCGEPLTLGTRQKQEVKVSDGTGSAVVQLWEENIGLLEEGRSYQLTNFRIIEYENVKYIIAMCWEGSEATLIEDLEGVVTSVDPAVTKAECTILKQPKIAAVFKLETFFKCLQCGSRTEPADGNETRCCNKDCGILNDSTFCEKFISAEVLVVDGDNRIRFTAFGDIVNDLVGKTDVSPTEEEFLRSPIFQLKLKNNEIVQVLRN